MRKTIYLLLLWLVFSIPLNAQQKHDELRKIYLEFAADSNKLDSSLKYGFCVFEAALKEYGDTSMQYFRAMNNIGVVFSEMNEFEQSRYWWLRCYKEIKKHKLVSFPATAAIIYGNLKVTYLYHFPNIKKATFFSDNYIRINRELMGDSNRSLLNLVCDVANNFDEVFGLGKAEKYYEQALFIRAKLFGQRSKQITHGMDSVFRLDSSTNTFDRRLELYSALDSAYALATLDSISLIGLDNNNYSWDCITYSQEMIDKALQQYGDTSHEFFKGLQRLAQGYHDFLHEDSAAIFLLKTGLSVLNEQNSEKSKSYIDLLEDLSNIYSDLENHEQAIATGKKMLILAEAVDGKESELYANASTELGRLYNVASLTDEIMYRTASYYLMQALAIKKKMYGDTSLLFGEQLQKLGGICIRWAKLDSAELLYLQAYKILASKNTPQKNYFLFRQLYMTYSYKDEMAKSHQWLEKCIDIMRQTGDTLNVNYLSDLYNDAIDEINLQNWPKSIKTLARMQNILDSKYKNTDDIYLSYLTLRAIFESRSGNYEGTDTLLSFVIESYSNPAYYDQSNYSIKRNISYASNELAFIYFHQKKHNAALKANQQSISKLLELGFNESTSVISINYQFKAQILTAMQRYDSAIVCFKIALKGLENGKWEKSIGYQEIKIDLASLYWEIGDIPESEKLMASACTQLKETMIRNMAGYSESEKQHFNTNLQRNIHKYYSLQRSIHGDHPNVNTTAFNFLLQSKGLLLSTSDYLNKAIAASGDSVLRKRLNILKNLRNLLAVAYRDKKNKKEQTISTDSLEIIAEKQEQLLSFDSPVFAEFQKQNNVTFNDVKESLSENEAAIEFIAFPYFNNNEFTDSVIYGAFVVRANSVNAAYIALGDVIQLKELVKNQGVSGRGATLIEESKESPANNIMYGQIWEPLLPYLQGVKKVFIASDGILNNVSFASLRDSNMQFLIDKYELHFILSTKDISKSKLSQRTAVKPSIALFGGAIYSLKNSGIIKDTLVGNRSLPSGIKGDRIWNYLPNTLNEANNIDLILKEKKWNIKTFVGEEASEDNLKHLGGTTAPAILHIATHGFYFPRTNNLKKDRVQTNDYNNNEVENPLLRTGLVFSAANDVWMGESVADGKEDGILTAFEFANIDLSKTRLVVLSACETGVGDVLNGEGVFGLQRAIRQAGISQMIVSLWPVPDRETAEMMREFYGALAKENNIVSAFRFAQSVMRNKYPNKPVLWAGFELIE